MKVLLLADICNPDWPSLPVVGYQTAKALSYHCDVTVVTQIRNRPNISRDGMGLGTVDFLDTERIAGPIHKVAMALRGHTEKAWTVQMAMDYPSYLAFEFAVWRRYKDDLKSGRFDVVHRITPMSPTQPSPLASLSPVPFIIGPLNGNLPWPNAFRAELSREREWLSYVRDAYKFLPYHRSTFARSAAVLAAFEHTVKDMPASAQGKVINFPEVGINTALFPDPPPRRTDQLTILFAGRLVPYKLAEVVVRAAISSDIIRQHRVVIAGDGPERERLQAMAAQANAHWIEFTGRLTQKEVAERMRESHIFAFPSIRELGAGVVVEAMAAGMACIVVDYGGPGTLIDSDRGIKIPVGPLDFLIGEYRREIENLIASPKQVEVLGTAARQHALTYYSWDRKAQKTVEIYEWVLGRRHAKPDFWH